MQVSGLTLSCERTGCPRLLLAGPRNSGTVGFFSTYFEGMYFFDPVLHMVWVLRIRGLAASCEDVLPGLGNDATFVKMFKLQDNTHRPLNQTSEWAAAYGSALVPLDTVQSPPLLLPNYHIKSPVDARTLGKLETPDLHRPASCKALGLWLVIDVLLASTY